MITAERLLDRLVSDKIRVDAALESIPPKKSLPEKNKAIPLTPVTRPEGPARILFDLAYLKDHTLTRLAQTLFNNKGIIPAGIINDSPQIRNVIETTESGSIISRPIIEVFRAQNPTSSPAPSA